MISIVIPIYNQANKLADCLDSILKQTYNNYEIIVVDDGSQDNLDEVLEKYKSILGYKLEIIHQENSGANVARNKGSKLAKGEFLLFCDADIEMKPDMLDTMLSYLQDNPGVSYVYSSHKFGSKTFRLWPFDADKLRQMPYIHTTSLIRKADFPGFDPAIKKFQDWDLWLTMLKQNHTGAWIDKILFKIKTGGTMSNWLPACAYKLLPFLPSVRRYKRAQTIIKTKHSL